MSEHSTLLATFVMAERCEEWRALASLYGGGVVTGVPRNVEVYLVEVDVYPVTAWSTQPRGPHFMWYWNYN